MEKHVRLPLVSHPAYKIEWTPEDKLCLERKYLNNRPLRALLNSLQAKDYQSYSLILEKGEQIFYDYMRRTPELNWHPFSFPDFKPKHSEQPREEL